MQFTPHARRRTPSVIIVSLIDVLLVVLIFLMVTTTAKKLEPSLKLSLPESKQAKASAADSKPFVISVATNFPYFFIENRPLTIDQVQKELAAAAQKDPQIKVAIKADKYSPVGEFIKVIDAAKVAQVGSVSAIVEKPAASK
ncbi:MAG: biopolymer transporter ExbD [Verrucomicrobia subdivision 3 bacterium]|nr:biopolymer transporter ExbD [Limisphaerales bacterium]